MSGVSRAFINAVADWSEIKTCQTNLLGKSIFPNVFVKASNICEKNRDGQTWLSMKLPDTFSFFDNERTKRAEKNFHNAWSLH